MEAKELRIGNLVECTKLQIKDKTAVINGFLSEDLETWVWVIYDYTNQFGVTNTNATPASIREIKPIPLTSEWKEKLGFKYNGVDYWENGNLILDSEDRLHIIDSSGYGIIITRCVDSVHKIQNIYHTLKGKELEVKEMA